MHTDSGASLCKITPLVSMCSGALANTHIPLCKRSTGHGTITIGNALHLESHSMNYDLPLASTCRQPPIDELQDNDFSWT